MGDRNPHAFQIGDRVIDAHHSPYLIAELSANHEQDLETTFEIIARCADAGFHAIKVQTYTPDTMTLDVQREEYVVAGGLWQSRRLYDLYAEAALPWEWTAKLHEYSLEHGLDFFSTPFDQSAVAFLEEIGVPAFKVASFEITDLPLLERIGATNKPVIVSTGMATFEEINEAIVTLRTSGSQEIALLKCTSCYPADPSTLNLATIRCMQSDFAVPIGYSDHTLGSAAAFASVVAGAVIVEKHVRACDHDSSPDSSFSLPACEFKGFTDQISLAFRMRGVELYGPTAPEEPSLKFRRSVIAQTDIYPGDRFTENNVTVRRPNIGAQPKVLPLLIGTYAVRFIERGEGIQLEDSDSTASALG